MFFLSLETSTVAFRTVLDELLCFFLALNLTSFQYFCQESFFFPFLFLFNENLPRKFPRKSREIGRFLREFFSSNPVSFHFFPRELSEALFRALFPRVLLGRHFECREDPGDEVRPLSLYLLGTSCLFRKAKLSEKNHKTAWDERIVAQMKQDRTARHTVTYVKHL